MDVLDFINRKGQTIVPNPKYDKKKKKSKEPQYISVLDDGTEQDPLIKAANYEAEHRITSLTKDVEKYTDYGLNYNPYRNMDAEIADAQSNWEKAFNSLGQSVISELALGIPKGFADIFDFVSSSILGLTEEDYQNPISETLQSWQDKFNEEIAPIYVNPEVNIQNGGLSDISWYLKNLPQVVTTLTLLIPAKTFSTGLSLLAKGTRLGKAARVATRGTRRFLTGMGKVKSAEELKAWQIALNNPRNLAKMNYGAQTIGEGLLMRTIENYQEARDTHIQTYENALDTLDKMSDEKVQYWLDSNPELKKEIEDKGIDTKDHDGIAKHIAKKAADRTFSMDFSNAVFDIIQLHSLNNIGAGVKKATGRAVRQAQKQSLEAAEQFATGTTKAAEKVGFLSKVGNGVKDFVKYNAKTALVESTEGIEEAVNYIAQQEGITYGKMLLENNHDVYDYNKFTGIWGSWSNMQGDLNTYMKSAELQESAFWGLMGGIIFQAGGDIANSASLALKRKANEKAAKKEAEETGIEIDIEDKIANLDQLFETNETKAARVSISQRQALISKLNNDLQTIEKGEDPFNRDELGKARPFQGIDLQLEKDIAKARLFNEFKSTLAIDAINSGTFDLLLDYFESEQVKKAMIKLGLAEEGNVDQFTEDTAKTLREVKNIYDREATQVLNQISAINSEKGFAWDAEDIPLTYAQQISFDNVNILLGVKSVDEQIAATRVLARERETDLSNKGNAEAFQGAAETIRIGSLIDLYSRLDAKQRYLESNKPTDSMESLAVAAELNNVKRQKKNILKDLSKETTIKGNAPITNVFNAIRTAQTYSYDKSIGKTDSERYGVDAKFDFSATDAQILKDTRKIFKDITGKETELDDDVISTTSRVFDESLAFYTRKDEGLDSISPELFGHYVTLSYLENTKTQLMSNLAVSRSEVADRVNYYHNMMNAARLKAIDKAEKIIRNAYTQYEGVEDENGHPIIEALIEAYKGDKQKAREIAESHMSDKSGNFVTAAEFLDALDIFNLNSSNNNFLFNWISNVLKETQNNIRQSRPITRVENETNQNGNTEASNPDLNGTSSEILNVNSEAGMNRQGQFTNINDSRPTKKIKFIVNNKGDIVSIKGRSGGKFDAIVYENNDETFELDIKSLPKSKQLDYVKKGLLTVDDDVDLMDENSKWEISENPLFVRVGNGYALAKNGQGVISKVVDNTENVDNTSSPVEEFTDETSPSPIETTTDEDLTLTNPHEKTTNLQVGDRVLDNITNKRGTISKIENGNYTVNLDDRTSISSINGESLSKEKEPVADISTGELRQPQLNDEQIATVVRFAFNNHIDNVLAKDLNIDEVARKSKEDIMSSEQSKSISEDTIDRIIESVKQELIDARKRVEALQNPLQQAGAALAYSCRVEEADNTDYSKMFYASVADFMKEYKKIVIVPEVDGKQVVRFEDILRICNNVYATADASIAGHMYAIIKSYLNTEEAKEKYIVTDINSGREIIDRITKTSEQLNNEYLSSNGFRVDVNSIMSSLEDPDLLERFFNVYDKLQVGDNLDLIKSGKELILQKDGVTIGRLPIPGRRNEDTYVQVNSGWVTDVKSDGKEGTVSRSKDIIIDLFCGTTKDHKNIRTLLEEISIKGGKIDQSHINRFLNNPLIDTLVKLSVLELPKKTNVLFVDNKTKKVDGDRVLSYLTNLWRYSQNNITGYSNQQRLDEVRDSINTWFSNLYSTYNTISQVDGNTTVNILKMTDGQIIRATEKEGVEAYDEYVTPSEGLSPNVEAKISIVDPRRDIEDGIIQIAGKESFKKEGFNKGSTLLSIFSRNAEPDFVNAYGVKLSDFNNLPKQFTAIVVAACNQLSQSFENIRLEEGTDKEIKNTENIIRNIISVVGDHNRIPLLKAFDTNVDVRINPFESAPGKGNMHGIEIVYTKRAKNPNESDKHVTVKIFDNDYYTKPFGLTIRDEINPDNNITLFPNGDNYKSIAKDATSAILYNFLIKYFNVNISQTGIQNDDKADTNFEGYINKRKGKLVVEMPNGDGTNTTIEYDNYSDYLVKGNLIKINTKKNENGSNFTRRGSNQKANAFMNVSLPVAVTSEKSNSKVSSEDQIERTSNIDTFGNLKEIIDKNRKNVRTELLREVLGEEEFNRFQDEAGLEFLDKIFPKSILYSNKANKRNKDGNWVGDVARTKISKDGRYYKYEGNKTLRPNIPKGIDTVVGPRWMNMASSNMLFRRQAAIRTLIHERLHSNIHNLSVAEQNKIFDAIEEVYNEYEKQLNRDLAITDSKDKRFKFVKYAKETKASLSNYTRTTPEKRLVLLEEFLVESLTNSNFFNYLNSIESETVDNKKEDNLFTKIAKLIAKIFGFDIKDNTLYMKELNILRDVFQENGVSSETEILTETKTSTNENVTTNEEIVEQEEVEEDETIEEEVKEDLEENDETDENLDEDIDEDVEIEEDEDIDEEYDDFSDRGQQIEEINVDRDGFTIVQNIEAFTESLPLEQKRQFEALRDAGLIEFKCR